MKRYKLLILFFAAAPLWADTIVIDNFDDGDLDGWNVIDTTVGQSFGPADINANDGELAFRSGGVVPRGAFSDMFAVWDGASDTQYSEGHLRANVRAETLGSFAYLYFRVSDDLESGYLFGATTHLGGRFGFNKVLGNQVVSDRAIDPSLSFGVNEWWTIEAGAIGDELSMKVWPTGDPEPEEPQLVFRDRSFETGTIAIGGIRHVSPPPAPDFVSVTFDDISFTPYIPLIGDFDNDGSLSSADVDLLSAAIRASNADNVFDINGDEMVDLKDHEHWVTSSDIAGTFFGDTNLDGEVLFNDFLALSASFGGEGGWAEGDFDGNGQVQFSDFLKLSANFGRTSPAIASVPEPASTWLLLLGLVTLHRTHSLCHVCRQQRRGTRLEPSVPRRVSRRNVFVVRGPSANMSEGFLHTGTRVAPSKKKFKQRISSIWRFAL